MDYHPSSWYHPSSIIQPGSHKSKVSSGRSKYNFWMHVRYLNSFCFFTYCCFISYQARRSCFQTDQYVQTVKLLSTFTPLLHLYCTFTAPLLHLYSTFTAPLLHLYSTFTAPLLHLYCTLLNLHTVFHLSCLLQVGGYRCEGILQPAHSSHVCKWAICA